MFSIIELKTAVLDYGIPGVSPIEMLLRFWMMLGIPMIPYFFLYLALRKEPAGAAARPAHVFDFAAPFHKFAIWVHVHHPRLLHH